MSWQNPSVIGIQTTETHTTAQYPLGTLVSQGGLVYQYVKATTALTQYFVYIITHNFECTAGVDQTNDDASPLSLGAPQMSGGIASGSFGWVAVGPGPCRLRVLASCAADVLIYTTTTAGALDDASASAKVVVGAKLTTANGGSAADAPALLATKMCIIS